MEIKGAGILSVRNEWNPVGCATTLLREALMLLVAYREPFCGVLNI